MSKQGMNHNDNIMEELLALAPALVPLQKLPVFTVPDNYFVDFSKTITAGISINNIALPAHTVNAMEVPAGYFEHLAGNILSKIKEEQFISATDELRQFSPALFATGNDNVFKVPNRYFADLPEIIMSQVQRPAKVFAMKPRSAIARYAVAAVITGIMGLSLFSIFDNKSIDNEAVSNTAVITAANSIILNNSFDKVLETVSEDEIVGYLEKNGQDVKAALVAAALDIKELPAADEYILNENTLDEFLDKLNINDYSN